MVLRFKIILLFVLLSVFAVSEAKESELDSKYVRVGYVSNTHIGNSDNSYVYNIGKIDGLCFATDAQLNAQDIGKKVLNILLQRDASGLHIDKLYRLALSNVALAEDERAVLDASADKRDVLKKLIVRQILSNNYIILAENNPNNLMYNVNWRLFHVDVDNRIIDQVFMNWDDMSGYDQIRVPVSLVAEGKAKSNDEILNAIIDKSNVIAPHSAILSRHPFTVGFGSQQGAKLLDRVEVYRLYEDTSGNVKVKRISKS